MWCLLHQLRRTQIGAIHVDGAKKELWDIEATRGQKIRQNVTHAGFDAAVALLEAKQLQKGDAV
jgi:hypothetical protein